MEIINQNYSTYLIIYFSIIIIIIVLFFVIKYYIYDKPETIEQNENEKFVKTSEAGTKFIGIVFFDIDGTTTIINKLEMSKIVQLCIDNNMMPGIITASKRTPYDLFNESWMPENFSKFLIKTGFITFNSDYPLIAGKIPTFYLDLRIYGQGAFKGFAMTEASKKLKIKLKNIILFDNMNFVIEGVKNFNSKLKVFCAGYECSNKINPKILSVRYVKKILENVKNSK